MNKIKCQNCSQMQCVNTGYKSYYCITEEGYKHLWCNYPPKRPPKSYQRLEKKSCQNTDRVL